MTPAAFLRLLRVVQRPGREPLAAAGGHHRLPGRIDSNATTFASAPDLASALRLRVGGTRRTRESAPVNMMRDWPDWYAAYMAAEHPAIRCRLAGPLERATPGGA